jgi:putative ABC transport system permease protein
MTNGFVWGLPWSILAAIAAAGLALVLASARPPASRAIRISPIDALRVPAT